MEAVTVAYTKVLSWLWLRRYRRNPGPTHISIPIAEYNTLCADQRYLRDVTERLRIMAADTFGEPVPKPYGLVKLVRDMMYEHAKKHGEEAVRRVMADVDASRQSCVMAVEYESHFWPLASVPGDPCRCQGITMTRTEGRWGREDES